MQGWICHPGAKGDLCGLAQEPSCGVAVSPHCGSFPRHGQEGHPLPRCPREQQACRSVRRLSQSSRQPRGHTLELRMKLFLQAGKVGVTAGSLMLITMTQFMTDDRMMDNYTRHTVFY